MVEHLEDFDGLFAYHTFFGGGEITLCPLGVHSMVPTNATNSSMQIKMLVSNMVLALTIVDTAIPLCVFVSYESKWLELDNVLVVCNDITRWVIN